MINHIIKSGLVFMFFKKYGSLLFLGFLASISFLIISLIHKDYIQYVSVSGINEGLLLSYFIKWMVYIVIVILMLTYMYRHPKTKPVKISKKFKRESLEKLKSRGDQIIYRKRDYHKKY